MNPPTRTKDKKNKTKNANERKSKTHLDTNSRLIEAAEGHAREPQMILPAACSAVP
jgi:hypothetical protein